MSTRSVLQSPLNTLKEKMLEQKEKIIEKGLLKRRSSSNLVGKGRESQLLNKEELVLLMENVRTLIVHLRARIELEKSSNQNATREEIAERTKVFETNSESSNPMRTLSDARTIRTVAETGQNNLLTALNKFTIPTIAGVVRLIFQSADVPLIKAEICGEIFSIQDAATKHKVPINIDELRASLGKAPARNIDILGQLIALLSVDSIGPTRLAYSWGPLIFLPRFDHKTSAAKEYESLQLLQKTAMVNSVTKLMIEQFTDVFGLDDETEIRKKAQEIREARTMDLKNAAMEILRVAKPPTSMAPSPAAKSTRQASLGSCRVMYDFEAEGALEISVKEDDVLAILEKGADEWWKVRTREGREGLVPETFVEEMGLSQCEEQEETVQPSPVVMSTPKKVIELPLQKPAEIITSTDFDLEPTSLQEKEDIEESKQENSQNIDHEIAELQRKLSQLQTMKRQSTKPRTGSEDIGKSDTPDIQASVSKKMAPPPLPQKSGAENNNRRSSNSGIQEQLKARVSSIGAAVEMRKVERMPTPRPNPMSLKTQALAAALEESAASRGESSPARVDGGTKSKAIHPNFMPRKADSPVVKPEPETFASPSAPQRPSIKDLNAVLAARIKVINDAS